MPGNFLSIPLAILLILAIHEAGRLVLRIFAKEDILSDPLDAFLLRLAGGYIFIGFLMSILGHLHIYMSWIFWLILIALLVSTGLFGRSTIGNSCRALTGFVRSSSTPAINRILLVILAVTLVMDFVLTMVPTTAWDSLTYHYPLPSIWLKTGGFIPVPGNCYSELPCGSEMIFLFGFGLGGLDESNIGVGHLVANHMTWLTGVFAVLSLVSISRKLGSSVKTFNSTWDAWTPGLIAALAFLSLPITFVEEMEGGYIENFLVFFSIVMLICLIEFRRNRNHSILAIIGLLAGGLLAAKHTSILLNAPVLLILLTLIGTNGNSKQYLNLLLAVVIAVIIPLPWYLKSYLHTGDMAWPFISEIILKKQDVPEIMYWSNPNVNRSALGFLWYIPRLTWDESLTQFDFRLLSWYFLPLLPFAIFWSFKNAISRTIGLLTWLMILFIYLLAPGEPRYMLAAWGLYAGLGAWGLLVFLKKFRWVTIYILPILLLLPICFSLVDRTREVNNRLPTIIGAAGVEEYFEKSLDIWPIVKFVNEETDEESSVIMVDPRVFYIQKPYTIWYPFHTPVTEGWDDLNNTNELITSWIDLNVEHVVISYGPNYRAIAIRDALRKESAINYTLDFPTPEIPSWVFKRASYAESVLYLDEEGYARIQPADGFEIMDFDVKSIFQLEALYRDYMTQVYTDDKIGAIFRLDDGIIEGD